MCFSPVKHKQAVLIKGSCGLLVEHPNPEVLGLIPTVSLRKARYSLEYWLISMKWWLHLDMTEKLLTLMLIETNEF